MKRVHWHYAGMMLAGVVSVAHAAPPVGNAVIWVEVKDPVVTPGESVEFTVWMSFDPPAPAVVEFVGKIVEIAGFGRIDSADIEITTMSGLAGTWDWWDIPSPFTNFSEVGFVYPNALVDIRLDNFLPYVNPFASKDNPILLFTASWKPDSYVDTKGTIRAFVMPFASIAGYLLPDKSYPKMGVLYASDGQSALFQIRSSVCLPDCDNDGDLTIDDFICFQTLYAIANPKADCDASGRLDIDDFLCFQTAYAIGC